MKKLCMPAVFLLMFFSCQSPDEEIRPVEEHPLENVSKSTEGEIALITEFLEISDEDMLAKLSLKLQTVSIPGKNGKILSFSDNTVEGGAISFLVNESNVIFDILSTATTLDKSGNIHGNVSTITGDLILSYTDKINGDVKGREVLKVGENLRTADWYDRFSDCVETVNTPFRDGFADLAFGVVANAATLGMWTPSTVLVCAVVGIPPERYEERNPLYHCSQGTCITLPKTELKRRI